MTGRPPPAPSRQTRSLEVALGALVVLATIVLLIAVASVLTSGSSGPTNGPATDGTASAAPSATSTPGGTSSSPSPSDPSPSTSASPGTVAVLVGAGDIGDCATREDSMTAALLDDIDGTVFTAGDNAYENGSAKEFATCYDDTWGRHKDRTRPTPGNHDWHTRELAGYFDYFGDAARGPDGRPWYSYDLGAWHVIMLDSECDKTGGCDADSAQGRWLASDLAGSDAVCTVAIWHKPRFSSGEHGNDRSVGPFWSALYEAGADVVINGHDHDYERFAPQDPAGEQDRDRGIRQFVAGTGGTPLRRFADPVANSELRAPRVHGVLKLTLRDRAYDWEFIPVSGDFSDQGTAFCH
jgi:acid phosphatase type 7